MMKSNFTVPKLSKPAPRDTLDTAPKFALPRLQKKERNVASIDSEYNSLSELVANHLSLLKSNGVTIYRNPTRTNNSETNEMSVLAEDASKLKLSEDVSLSREEFEIDLTPALTAVESTPTLPQKNKKKTVLQSFEIPFIDCETELSQPVDTLECKLDISDIMFTKLSLCKGVSKFGKALCRKYRRRKPYKFDFDYYGCARDFKVFNFATPSPDDMILSCLKKA